MKNPKQKPEKSEIKRISLREIQDEPSEKFFLSLPSGISVAIESSKRNVEQLANLGISTVNEVVRWFDLLKTKQKVSYLG